MPIVEIIHPEIESLSQKHIEELRKEISLALEINSEMVWFDLCSQHLNQGKDIFPVAYFNCRQKYSEHQIDQVQIVMSILMGNFFNCPPENIFIGVRRFDSVQSPLLSPSFTLRPIGIIHSTRKEIFDDKWDRESSYIELDSNQFETEALLGLDDFSHVQILFYMNKVNPNKITSTARHPRNNPSLPKYGIFAQRGKNRPNRVGLTCCNVLHVEGLKLYIKGLDAIDGTPVIDIKPYLKEFSPRGVQKQPLWTEEVMKNYWEET